eukprot:Awhi_evm2s1211
MLKQKEQEIDQLKIVKKENDQIKKDKESLDLKIAELTKVRLDQEQRIKDVIIENEYLKSQLKAAKRENEMMIIENDIESDNYLEDSVYKEAMDLISKKEKKRKARLIRKYEKEQLTGEESDSEDSDCESRIIMLNSAYEQQQRTFLLTEGFKAFNYRITENLKAMEAFEKEKIVLQSQENINDQSDVNYKKKYIESEIGRLEILNHLIKDTKISVYAEIESSDDIDVYYKRGNFYKNGIQKVLEENEKLYQETIQLKKDIRKEKMRWQVRMENPDLLMKNIPYLLMDYNILDYGKQNRSAEGKVKKSEEEENTEEESTEEKSTDEESAEEFEDNVQEDAKEAKIITDANRSRRQLFEKLKTRKQRKRSNKLRKQQAIL